ncbi:unnamed protein product [marine sediment metagenome]|uniref:DUF4878 domain-containing protein n=1 Tax=marine sediment metagenome TaxID=412755 RepID=X0VL97_9ZZZZ
MRPIVQVAIVLGFLGLNGCRKAAKTAASAKQAGGAFIQAAAAADPNVVYSKMTHVRYRGAVSLKRHLALFDLGRQRLGAPKQYSCTNWSIRCGPQATAKLTYQVTWERGDGTVNMTLIQEASGWKLLSYYVNSDALVGLNVE